MKFDRLTSRLVPLPHDNVDTDQIIPARFLKTTTKAGMGKLLFHDWRYHSEGKPKHEFILNQPHAAGRSILLAGHNFGCGSSREHAPWALTDHGFRAVISTSFADIFRNNALKNGLLPVLVDKEVHQKLFEMVEADHEVTVTIDLASQSLLLPDGSSVGFPIDPFSKKCLLEGVDDLGYLLEQEDRIAQYEQRTGRIVQ